MVKQRRLTAEDRRLARKIKLLRGQHSMTQEKLSEVLGKNPNYIAFIESGQRGISLPTLQKLAKLFGISVKDFFDK